MICYLQGARISMGESRRPRYPKRRLDSVMRSGGLAMHVRQGLCYQRMSEAARARAARYSWTSVGAEFERLYAQAASLAGPDAAAR